MLLGSVWFGSAQRGVSPDKLSAHRDERAKNLQLRRLAHVHVSIYLHQRADVRKSHLSVWKSKQSAGLKKESVTQDVS